MRTNKPEVKRYGLEYGYDSMMRRVNRMKESEDGVYVRFDDYEELQAECEELVEALSIARDYVFSSLEEKKLALAGHPQMWRCEQDDLAIIDAALSTHLKGCE